MDYGKFKYEQNKKQQQSKKHQVVTQTKEIKFRPRTDEHDFQVKLRHIRRFLTERDKVKVTLMFRGREMAYTDQGVAILDRVVKEAADISTVDTPHKLEGRALTLLLAPKGEVKKST